jgi:hypothetical protein
VREFDFCCCSAFVSCCSQKLVAEAGRQFRNPEEGEHPPLKAVSRKLLETQQAEKT